jgi:hypothetical protein
VRVDTSVNRVPLTLTKNSLEHWLTSTLFIRDDNARVCFYRALVPCHSNGKECVSLRTRIGVRKPTQYTLALTTDNGLISLFIRPVISVEWREVDCVVTERLSIDSFLGALCLIFGFNSENNTMRTLKSVNRSLSLHNLSRVQALKTVHEYAFQAVKAASRARLQ